MFGEYGLYFDNKLFGLVCDNKLFIKPMEKNIRTNMTIITNKRTYQFDIVSKELEDENDKDLVYVVRFQYPKKAR